MHEKGLQRQKGVGTWTNSQERRAAVVLVIKRGSTGYRIPPSVPIGLHRISFVRASENMFRTIVYDALGCKRDGCVLGEPTLRHPVLPGPALPRRPALCPPRTTPPVVCPGIGFNKILPGQLSVSTSVSNRERRARFVPRIHRLSTSCQPDFCSSIGLTKVSFDRSSRNTPRRAFFDRLQI